MEGSHDNITHWGEPQESWDPSHGSLMYNSGTEDMNIVDSSQWQQPSQDSASAFSYQQPHAFAPQPDQHQIYQNGSWIAQGQVNIGVDNANPLQAPSSMYGSIPQNVHHIDYSQPPNGSLYDMHAAAQQQTQPVKQMPQAQFHQTIANTRLQHAGSPTQLQQPAQNQAVPVSYPGIQSMPQHHQGQGTHTPPVQTLPPQPLQQPTIQGHYSQSPQLVPRQPTLLAQPQLQYAQIPITNTQQRLAATFQPMQQATAPKPSTPQPAALTPAVSYSPAPTQPLKPRFQILDESTIPGAKAHFKPATHLLLGNGSKLVPAYNYKFKVVEARHSTSGKPILGSQSLPCEIERDTGRAYRECATAPDATPAQQDSVLNKYRDAMKKIGRPITDPSRGPSKRKERTGTLVSISTSSDEYSESEDDDELPPPPLDGPRPGPDQYVERAVWDTLKIVWTSEDVPSKEDTRSRFIDFGEYLLRLSKDFIKAVKEGNRDCKNPHVQGLLQAVEATSDYATPYILMHLGETDKALGALANCLLALYNKGYKDDETRSQVVLILSLLAEFGTVSEARYQEIRLAKIVPRMGKRFGGEVEELRQRIERKLWKKEASSDSPPSNVKTISNTASAFSTANPLTTSSPSITKASTTSSKMEPEEKRPIDGPNKSSKRAREDDTINDAPATKKPTGESRIKKVASSVAAPPAIKIVKAGGLLPGKLPGKHVLPVKSSTAISTGNASKMPVSTSTVASKPAVAGTSAKAEKKQQPQTSDGSASRLGALLDSISNSASAKQEESKKKKEASETPEQRERRIRREKRGAHRVRWKEDDILIEVRTFVTEEDPSSRPSAKAGANRHRDEGEVLKSASKHKDIEDDDTLALLTADWTSPPSLYNFSLLPLETFKDSPFRYREVIVKNVDNETGVAQIDGSPDLVVPERRQSANGTDELFAIIRDPNINVETEDQRERTHYENTVLMVAYQSWDDIPPTPRSPTRAQTDVVMSDAPKHLTLANSDFSQEIIRRYQEIKSQGRDTARDNALRRMGKTPAAQPGAPPMNPTLMDALARLGAFNNAQPAQQAQPSIGHPALQQSSRVVDPRALLAKQNPPARVFATQEEREAETGRLLNLIKERPSFDLGLPQTAYQRDQLHPAAQKADEFLAPIFAQFAGKQAKSSEPPAYIMNDSTRVREWFDGIRRDEEAKQREHNLKKAKSVTAAIKIITDRAAAAEAAQAAQPVQATSAAAIDHAAAWHAYNTMSEQEYAAWWQKNAQQQAAAQPAAQPTAPIAPVNVYEVYDPSQAQAQQQQQPTTSQYATPQQAVPAISDPLQVAQSDPNFAQYLQIAYALQAQQSQDGSVGQQSHQQQEPGPNSPPSQEHRDGSHTMSARTSNHNNEHNYNRHDSHHQSRKKDRHHKPIKASLIGTKPCTFYRKGKCTKGANCTYRHD